MAAAAAGCLLGFLLLEARSGDLAWLGDSSILNISRFLFIPVPGGSV